MEQKIIAEIIHVSVSCFAISFVLTGILSAFLVFFPKQIASIWSEDPVFLDISSKAFSRTYYLTILWGFQFTAIVILSGMKEVFLSICQSILTSFVPLPIISTILHFTDPSDPIRIYWTYIITDGWTFLISALFLIKPIRNCIINSKLDLNAQPLISETETSFIFNQSNI